MEHGLILTGNKARSLETWTSPSEIVSPMADVWLHNRPYGDVGISQWGNNWRHQVMQAKTQNVTFSPEGSFQPLESGRIFTHFTLFTLFWNAHADSKLGESGETVPVVGQTHRKFDWGWLKSGFATRNDRITKVKWTCKRSVCSYDQLPHSNCVTEKILKLKSLLPLVEISHCKLYSFSWKPRLSGFCLATDIGSNM